MRSPLCSVIKKSCWGWRDEGKGGPVEVNGNINNVPIEKVRVVFLPETNHVYFLLCTSDSEPQLLKEDDTSNLSTQMGSAPQLGSLMTPLRDLHAVNKTKCLVFQRLWEVYSDGPTLSQRVSPTHTHCHSWFPFLLYFFRELITTWNYNIGLLVNCLPPPWKVGPKKGETLSVLITGMSSIPGV